MFRDLPPFFLAVMLVGCGPDRASTDMFCSHDLSREQLRLTGWPNLDMGSGNVGLYSAGKGSESPRFSLLNCKTARFAQIRYGTDISALKGLVDGAVAADATRTVDRFSASIKKTPGASVIDGKARRIEMTRHSCVCTEFYRDEWFDGFPEGYVRDHDPQ